MLTVCGVSPGLSAHQAGEVLMRAGARFKGFEGDAATYSMRPGKVYVHLNRAGSVVTVAGPRLESDGELLAARGYTGEQLVAVLGEPECRAPAVAERVLHELEHDSPDVARRAVEMLEEAEREFWHYVGGRLKVLVEGGRVALFVLGPGMGQQT